MAKHTLKIFKVCLAILQHYPERIKDTQQLKEANDVMKFEEFEADRRENGK